MSDYALWVDYCQMAHRLFCICSTMALGHSLSWRMRSYDGPESMDHNYLNFQKPSVDGKIAN